MTELIIRELREVGIMLMCGMSVMFVLNTRAQIVKQLNIKGRLEVFFYIGSWICASFIFSEFIYSACYGKVTWYGLIDFALGIGLWKKLLCDIIYKSVSLNKREKKDKRYEKEKKI